MGTGAAACPLPLEGVHVLVVRKRHVVTPHFGLHVTHHRVPSDASHGNALTSSATFTNANCANGVCLLDPMFQYFPSPGAGGFSQAMDFVPVRAGCVGVAEAVRMGDAFHVRCMLGVCARVMCVLCSMCRDRRVWVCPLHWSLVVHSSLRLQIPQSAGLSRYWNCRDDNTLPPTDVRGRNMSALVQSERAGVRGGGATSVRVHIQVRCVPTRGHDPQSSVPTPCAVCVCAFVLSSSAGADACDSMRCFASSLQSAGFSAGGTTSGRCYRTNCFTSAYLQVCTSI
jgi:hypothetical protein